MDEENEDKGGAEKDDWTCLERLLKLVRHERQTNAFAVRTGHSVLSLPRHLLHFHQLPAMHGTTSNLLQTIFQFLL